MFKSFVVIFKIRMECHSMSSDDTFLPNRIYKFNVGEDFSDSWIEDTKNGRIIKFTHEICDMIISKYNSGEDKNYFTFYDSIVVYLKHRKEELKGKKHGKKQSYKN